MTTPDDLVKEAREAAGAIENACSALNLAIRRMRAVAGRAPMALITIVDRPEASALFPDGWRGRVWLDGAPALTIVDGAVDAEAARQGVVDALLRLDLQR